ncbi:MAG: arginine deiminase [Eubacteriaceae bacterium]|jgi:arginine deiminase|nr:arginine deiminase [Eubacteriaceae bacterium]MDK2904601.1 arginine deiminase [Eubacteriaceae bacterium]MDK2935433.1 arginine deiminase [Eubacteriaceae bacterium]MDK2960990.1 arginine deiminase [Eubacteriaceae bacterium]MDN5306885.1 arginine deiminase [Eubacteriaceae bacterium]
METFLNIHSEIGTLKRVLLHRPGKELERIVPDSLKELLFEDIPWLKRMQEEHDEFAGILKNRGVEVLYVEDLLKDVLKDKAVREGLILEVIDQNPSSGNYIDGFLTEYLMGMESDKLSEALIAGVLQKELDHVKRHLVLTDYLKDPEPYAFYLNPLPNLYFMRDPAVTIANAMSISSMATKTRKRESQYLDAIYSHHPLFGDLKREKYYKYQNFFSLEGGDLLVLSEKVVAVGCSERTRVQAVEELAKNLFAADQGIEQVLAVRIPNNRAFMHLDTVFTMVNCDQFIVFPGILDQIETVIISRGKEGGLSFQRAETLKAALARVLGLKQVQLIESGGGNPVVAAREQWNDSTNTLAIAPGVIVAYARNERSNEVLEDNGVEVIGIEASELVRGRGGPRCMTMPLYREKI